MNNTKQKNYIMKKAIQLTIMCLLLISNMIHANSNSPNNNGRLVCNVTATTSNGTITVLGMDATTNTKLFTSDYATVWECNPWFGSPCSANEVISGLTTGTTYYLSVNSDDCSEWIPITVEGGGGNCSLNATLSNCTYTNAGTYTYDIFVTATNTSSNTFKTAVQVGSTEYIQTFAYNQTHTISELYSPNQEANVVVWESENPDCTTSTTVTCQPIDDICGMVGTISNCTSYPDGRFNYDLIVTSPTGGTYLIYLYDQYSGPYTRELTYNETHQIGESGYTTPWKRVEDVSNPDCYTDITYACTTAVSEVTIENCPENITVELPLEGGETIVTWTEPYCNTTCTGSDGICFTNQTSGPANGDSLSEGVYTVTYDAGDGCGNTATCSFTIEVQGIGGCNINYAIDLGDEGNNKIVVTGLTANTNAKLFTDNYTTLWGCDPWNGSACSNNEIIEGLFLGETYYLSVQSDVCDEWIPITLNGGGCNIAATVSNCTVNGAGLRSFDIYVTGNNTPGATFDIDLNDPVNGIQTFSYAYNETHSIGEYNFNFSLSKPITDSDNPSCSTIAVTECTVPETEISIENCPEDIIVYIDDAIEELVTWNDPYCNTTCAVAEGICFTNQVGGPENGSYFQEGTYTITYEAQDACGNTDACSFTVTVEQFTGECNLPANISNCTFNNSGMYSYDIFVSSPNIFSTTFKMPIMTGQGTIIQEYAYGTTHSVSEIFLTGNQITKIITDTADPNCNTTVTSECSFQSIVTMLNCQNVSVTLPQGANNIMVSWDEVICGSTCGGDIYDCDVTQIFGPANGTTLSAGEYLVVYEGQDPCNSTSTCSFTVTVSEESTGCNVNVTTTNGDITITGLTGAENTKLFDADFNVVFECNPWNGNPCTGTEEVFGLNIGETYYLSVQSDVCDEWIPVTIDVVDDCFLAPQVTNVSCTPTSVTYDLFVTGVATSSNKFAINLQAGFDFNTTEFELNQTHTITEYLLGGEPPISERTIQVYDPNLQGECFETLTFQCAGDCVVDTDGDGTCDEDDCEPTNPFLPTTPGSSCSDGDFTTINDMIQEDGCTCIGTPATSCANGSSNLALGAATKQSSTITHAGITASSDLAVDGNTDGDFNNGSVSATQEEFQAWWEVDLGDLYEINLIEIYNKTNGSDVLNDYWFMVSDTPFIEDGSLEDNLAISDHSKSKNGIPSSYSFRSYEPGIQGRYLRIQLEGTGYCTIAEVQITGCPTTAPAPTTTNFEENLSENNRFKINSIFPNPTFNELFVQIESLVDEDLTVQIYDNIGSLKHEETRLVETGNNTFEFELNRMNAGIYHVVLMNKKGQTKSIRFVKIKD